MSNRDPIRSFSSAAPPLEIGFSFIQLRNRHRHLIISDGLSGYVVAGVARCSLPRPASFYFRFQGEAEESTDCDDGAKQVYARDGQWRRDRRDDVGTDEELKPKNAATQAGTIALVSIAPGRIRQIYETSAQIVN